MRGRFPAGFKFTGIEVAGFMGRLADCFHQIENGRADWATYSLLRGAIQKNNFRHKRLPEEWPMENDFDGCPAG